MANTTNFNLYKPEATDPYNKVGYGFGPDESFEKLILSITKDDTLDVLTKKYYLEILGDFASKIDLLTDCLDKTRITSVINDADTTHAITANKINAIKTDCENVSDTLNGNSSIDDKLFIRCTTDITNNTNDVFKLKCSGLDYYFYSNTSGTIFYKDKLNNGADRFTNQIGFKGKNIIKYFSEYYGQEMYYSVWNDKVYVADDVFSETVIQLNANGNSNYYIKEINGALFLLKTNSSGLHSLEYSTDGYNFISVDLPKTFDVNNANIFYIKETTTFYMSNDDGLLVKIKNGMSSKTVYSNTVYVGTDKGKRETKILYNGKDGYSVVSCNGNLYLYKYDFINGYNVYVGNYPFNTTANFVECGGGIFFMKEKDLYIYCPTTEKFRKIYYFTQNNAASKIESNENGISFSKSNNSPAVKYYLWKEDVFTLRELIEQFGDSVVEH